MTLIDIKNLHTTDIKQVKEWCEQELIFRKGIGIEIERRNYPEGSFEHMINSDAIKHKSD